MKKLIVIFLLLIHCGLIVTPDDVFADQPGGHGLFDNPNIAAVSSLLFPGSSQIIHGKYAKGSGFLGMAAVSYAASLDLRTNDDMLSTGDMYDEEHAEIYTNSTTTYKRLADNILQNTMFMSAYDAYKDSVENRHFKHNVKRPTESVTSLFLAPFKFENLKQKSTYLPLLPWIAFAMMEGTTGAMIHDSDVSEYELHTVNLSSNLFTGVGEESFFRGYLNTELSHHLGERVGLIGSSLIFGAVHSGEGKQATFIGSSIIGGYLGWRHQANNYRLSQSVAIHFWWNFISNCSSILHGGEGTIPIFQFAGTF